MVWIIISILAVLLATFVVLFLMIQKGFHNPVEEHTVPEELPFDVQEIKYHTKNNKTIYAWWIPVDPQAVTVIFVHGWGRNAQRMMPYLKKFCCGKMDNAYGQEGGDQTEIKNHLQEQDMNPLSAAGGFNLLAFDARGHGNSDNDGYSNMLKFSEDIIASMNYLEQTQGIKNNTFYLIGLSIGGSASIYAAAHDPRIKKVLTVGAFAHPAAVITRQIKDHHVPYFPLIWFLYRYLKYVKKLDVDAMAPEKHIAGAQAHFLLVQGEDDKTVPVEQGKRLKKAAGDKAELWIMPGRGHSDCHLETGFWKRLKEFFNTPEQNIKSLNLAENHSL